MKTIGETLTGMITLEKKRKDQQMINCQEAHNLWDMVTSMYQLLYRMHIWRNFVHDADLGVLIDRYLDSVGKDVQHLESEMKKFEIKGPDSGVTGVNTAANTEILRDEFIALDLLVFIQERVEMLLRALRTTTTNDHLREIFITGAKRSVDDVDGLIKYLRRKGWLNQPPLYPNMPADVTEQLDAGEAFHLWDHLTFRYDNIHQTEFYGNLANDPEFKALLKMGVQNVLMKQVSTLEKECLHFGIPLPKHPPNVVATPGSEELLFDDYMFRQLNIGITGAAILHATALKQCVTNDRIRGLFKELLLSEIDIHDKIIKYGKLNGYLAVVPQYNLG